MDSLCLYSPQIQSPTERERQEVQLPTKTTSTFIAGATQHIRLLRNTKVSLLTLTSVLVADCLMKDFMTVLRPREPGVIISIWFFCTVCMNERMCGAILYRDTTNGHRLDQRLVNQILKKTFLRMQKTTENRQVDFCRKLLFSRLKRLLWLHNGFILDDGQHYCGQGCSYREALLWRRLFLFGCVDFLSRVTL